HAASSWRSATRSSGLWRVRSSLCLPARTRCAGSRHSQTAEHRGLQAETPRARWRGPCRICTGPGSEDPLTLPPRRARTPMNPFSRRWARFAALFAVAIAGASADPAAAQYFGRNAVQWDTLKFALLKTEHFDLHYYPEEREAAEQVGRMAERWYTRLSGILDYRLKARQPIILYASHPHFQQPNTVGGPPGEGTGGVTEALKRRIVLPVGASLAETDHVLGHELVHAYQYAITGQGKVSASNFPSALRMPLWFI